MVNAVIVERILADIRANLNDLRAASDITWDIYRTDTRARRFVERTLHVLIEGCIDIVQHIIADEGMREPKNYRDGFAVLAEHGIFKADELNRFENMASFRNLLVHYYERIDDEIVYGIFKKNLTDFDRFSARIADYLKKQSLR